MIYAKIGESLQQIGGECPDGFIVMQSQRPDGDFIAATDGTWVNPNTLLTKAEIKKKNLQDLIDTYNADVSATRSKIIAYIAEGETTNADKITAERANLASIKSQFTADRTALLKS